MCHRRAQKSVARIFREESGPESSLGDQTVARLNTKLSKNWTSAADRQALIARTGNCILTRSLSGIAIEEIDKIDTIEKIEEIEKIEKAEKEE